PSLLTPRGNIGDAAVNGCARGGALTGAEPGAELPGAELRRVYGEGASSNRLQSLASLEAYLSAAFKLCSCDASRHPLLLTLPPNAPPSMVCDVAELAFEKFGPPALFLADTASLAAFANGRTTAMVLDCGAGAASATPVVDGVALKGAARRSLRGGDWLDTKLRGLLEAHLGRALEPRRAPGAPAPAGAHRAHLLGGLLADFKQAHAPMLQFARVDLREVRAMVPEGAAFELPDGTEVRVPECPEAVRVGEFL
ncbi:hypothetical protein TeGR_g995, partial [Tetraparma gracilis]